MTLRVLDLFSGIGGFSLAARWLGGFETVQFVERDPFCQRILHKHWPTIPIHDDICTFQPEPESADVVCGGFPCQDISIAGKQAGIRKGTRSGLFYELMRVVRLVGPQYVVLENVANITSNGLDTVLGTLAEAGFDAEWACIPAADVGACHRRDRWWCVAYASGTGPQDRKQAWIGKDAAQGGTGLVSIIRRSLADAADATGGRDSRSDQHAGQQIQSERMGESGVFNTPHPHHQRQQERQPAAITGRERRPCWGDAPRRLNPDWRSYLSEPVLCRGDDGLSNLVDRLRALGNAVVPQVAAIPLARVLDLHHGRI
jgi:DNA (cytosine-5)-methyltransferase 1